MTCWSEELKLLQPQQSMALWCIFHVIPNYLNNWTYTRKLLAGSSSSGAPWHPTSFLTQNTCSLRRKDNKRKPSKAWWKAMSEDLEGDLSKQATIDTTYFAVPCRFKGLRQCCCVTGNCCNVKCLTVDIMYSTCRIINASSLAVHTKITWSFTDFARLPTIWTIAHPALCIHLLCFLTLSYALPHHTSQCWWLCSPSGINQPFSIV